MWFAVPPSDSRDKWPKDLLVDRRIKQFWDELSSVTCVESLTQEKFNEK